MTGNFILATKRTGEPQVVPPWGGAGVPDRLKPGLHTYLHAKMEFLAK